MNTLTSNMDQAVHTDRASTASILWQLVKKDYYFNRVPLMLYLLLGVISLFLISLTGEAAFYIGACLLITVVIVVGIHLVFATVIYERSKQTLPLVMSLPITFMQYSWGKLLTNIGVYLLAWLVLYISAVAVILSKSAIPDGLIPFTTILMLEMFMAFVLILAVAMISESEAWTIVIMSIANVCVSIFMFGINQIEGIRQHINGPEPVWNASALTVIGIELVVMVALIGITLLVQSKKRDFL